MSGVQVNNISNLPLPPPTPNDTLGINLPLFKPIFNRRFFFYLLLIMSIFDNRGQLDYNAINLVGFAVVTMDGFNV
jgi:hypothetical protein